jgi:hypothetical protein
LAPRAKIVALTAVAAAVVGLSAAASSPAAVARCKSSFTVLHNDSVGALSIPKGQYYLTPMGLNCATASELFTRFLDDFDGVLPGGWTVNAASPSFVNSVTGQSISIGSPLPPTPSPRGVCPGTFTVEHNDRIGALSLRAGKYQITTRGGLSCSTATSQLAFFLFHDFAGTLPKPWKLGVAAKRFSRGKASFTVKFVGRNGKSGGGGVHPNLAITCPNTVSVAAPTTLGALIIPAGSYYINVFSNLSCSTATALFKQFLTAGALPVQWTLVPDTGTFLRGNEGFQIESTA